MGDQAIEKRQSAGPAGRRLIVAQHMFDGATMRGPCAVEVDGRSIGRIMEPADIPDEIDVIHLPDDHILAPGLIDLQVNGGGGVLLNDLPDAAGAASIAAAHRRMGTTGLLPTLITDDPEVLWTLQGNAADILKVPGVLGLHIEGPFINAQRHGIHPLPRIRTMTEADVEMLMAFRARGSCLVTLAPECVPARLVERLVSAGLTVAIGHSAATAEEVLAVKRVGVRAVTHLFNAMSQITPREPGVVGAVLSDDALTAGIICDGLHVAPANLRIAHKMLGPERLFLVSDAMPSVGSGGGGFTLHGRQITLNEGRLTDDQGTLAGAHLTMLDAVRNAVTLVGLPIRDALMMATATPAKVIGHSQIVGSIRPGLRADLVAFGPRGAPMVWQGGQLLAPGTGQ